MRLDAVAVPPFGRLTDWFGIWAMTTHDFACLWRAALSLDFASHLAAGPTPRPASRMEMHPGKGGSSIAVVPIGGTMMKSEPSMGGTSTVQVRRDVRAAADDPNVSGILLRIDSPGGTVAGTADLAADVRAARRKKPVWAQVEDGAASAAYWVASQTDAIYANAGTALVGSIGTLFTVYDASAAAEKEGVKAMVFATGPLKGAGFPGAPITEEQSGYFQRLVNETQSHFDAAVQKGRGMTATQLAAVRTGGVFPAGEALALKLIDGIRSTDSTLAALAAAR